MSTYSQEDLEKTVTAMAVTICRLNEEVRVLKNAVDTFRKDAEFNLRMWNQKDQIIDDLRAKGKL